MKIFSRRNIAAAIAVLVVLIALADLGSGALSEQRLSRKIQSVAGLPAQPDVSIPAFPFLPIFFARPDQGAGREYDEVNIRAAGVPVAGADPRAATAAQVDLETVLTGVSIDSDTESIDVTARHVMSRIRIDALNLGRLLGINDLQLTTPAPTDTPGAGSPADGAVTATEGIIFTGTMIVPETGDPQARRKVSIRVNVSILGANLRLDATTPYEGPDEHVQTTVSDSQLAAIGRQLERPLPILRLPFGVAPTEATSEGSDLLLVGRATDLVSTMAALASSTT